MQTLIKPEESSKIVRVNCRKLALNTRRQLFSDYNKLYSENPSVSAPKLTIITVGANKASEKFISRKLKMLTKYNIEHALVTLKEDSTVEQIKAEIEIWNNHSL